MTLLEHINILPKLRNDDLPERFGDIGLVVRAEEMDNLDEIMARLPGARLRQLVVWDAARAEGKKSGVPVCAFSGLKPDLGLDYVVCLNPLYGYQVMRLVNLALSPAGIERFYLLYPGPERVPGRQSRPDFYSDHSGVLENIYRDLADEASRRTYAALVKTRMSGLAAYTPVAQYSPYYHPLIRPEKGDVMIDGGVSNLVDAQKEFSANIGPQGTILGFEPIPRLFSLAKKSLEGYPNYRLFCLGLGEKREKLNFIDRGDASRVSDGADGTVECQITDIDGFMSAKKIRKLDCIKLDVEGSELAALKGAEQSIKTLRPKLIVCLYHKLQDLYEIPAYIKSLVPEYDLYIAQHSVDFLDAVLYAKAPR